MASFSVSQAIIAAMITPALLILAAGSLISTSLVRLGRIVDRVRELIEMEGGRVSPEELRRHQRRGALIERSMRLFFVAVLCFVGAGFGIGFDRLSGDQLTWLPVGLTALGMTLLVIGSAAMVTECNLSSDQLQAELRLLHATVARIEEAGGPAPDPEASRQAVAAAEARTADAIAPARPAA